MESWSLDFFILILFIICLGYCNYVNCFSNIWVMYLFVIRVIFICKIFDKLFMMFGGFGEFNLWVCFWCVYLSLSCYLRMLIEFLVLLRWVVVLVFFFELKDNCGIKWVVVNIFCCGCRVGWCVCVKWDLNGGK